MSLSWSINETLRDCLWVLSASHTTNSLVGPHFQRRCPPIADRRRHADWPATTHWHHPHQLSQVFGRTLLYSCLNFKSGLPLFDTLLLTACTIVQAVIKANSQCNGKGQILTPWGYETPERISMKLGTTSWVCPHIQIHVALRRRGSLCLCVV